ncbi:hypothetical protein ACFQZI_17745 [Mucilaginibacter lutimaris]|uniref:DUF2624 family protein n=1 Tax=Mucilaginibacter lutimaris TaxID=931629 RepID=A0ABW2ZKH7_9SPHI
MKGGLSEKRNVTPQQAIKILEENGYEINEKEAEMILDFLYFLGKLTVDQYIKDASKTKDTNYEDSRSLCAGEHR